MTQTSEMEVSREVELGTKFNHLSSSAPARLLFSNIKSI